MEAVFEAIGFLVHAVIFIAIAIGVVAGAYFLYTKGKKLAAVGAVIAGVLALAIFLSVTIVPPGTVGVITTAGAVQNETLPPGFHLRIPFINSVHIVDTRVLPHPFTDLDASSHENLSLKVTGIMNYHVDGAFASALYQTVGDDFAPKIIDPAFADYIKQIIPQYSADSTQPNWALAHRDEIRKATKDALNVNLARYHIVIDDIYIANIANPDDYEAAIRARQVAQQQVETERQIVEQKKQQANQAVEAAKGEANAKIEQAKGDAQASIEGNKGRIALAETQARSNKLLSDSLTAELIQYNLIQRLADKIQVVYLPSNGNFFLDPTKTLNVAK